MGWLSCCIKPFAYEDPEDIQTDIAIQISKHEAEVQEDAEFNLAIQESSRLEEERRRASELEKDAQIALAIQNEETEREMENSSALQEEDDENFARIVDVSLKEKEERERVEEQVKRNEQRARIEEQVKRDKQLALLVHGNLNKIVPPPRIEEHESISRRAPLDVDKQRVKAVEKSLMVKGKGKLFEDEQFKKNGLFPAIPRESLKEKGKGKLFEDEQVKNDGHLAAVLQGDLSKVESPPQLEENQNISDEHEQRIIWESFKGKGPMKQPEEDEVEVPMVNPTPSLCGGCGSAVEGGGSLNVLGVLWHPGCFCCDACGKRISIQEVETHVSNSRGKFHNSCYQRFCYICKERKMRAFNHHPFWKERYCQTHEADGTPTCCSCERLEPRGTIYVMLGDGRRLCLECMESSLMDSFECQYLHTEIREFFEGLNMKIEKEFPFLLVERQALNKAEEKEKIDNRYEVVTRGICLSEEQIVPSITRKPRMGPNNRLIDMGTESLTVTGCDVTAILILYGLPKLLTGYILAHEMMHAYLRLNGYKIRNDVLEEGICQVLGHMWLESKKFSSNDTASSSSSSRTPPPQAATTATKKSDHSEFEKRLVEFCRYQIEEDESPVYGLGFKKVNEMMISNHHSIKDTLKQIQRRS